MPNRFSPEKIEAIAADLKVGMGKDELMAKHNISASAYWNWRKRLAKGIKAAKKTEPSANGHASPNRIRDAIVARLNRDPEFYTRVLVMALE